MLITILLLSSLVCLVFVLSDFAPAVQPEVTVTGDWQVQVKMGEETVLLAVTPAEMIAVTAEKYEHLPLFDDTAAGWGKGVKLCGVTTQETTAKGYLEPESVMVAAAPAKQAFECGRDYAIDLEWGTFGRLTGGRIGEMQPVYVSYRHGVGRIDSIMISKGLVTLRTGTPCINVPEPPAVEAGEKAVANIWVPGRLARLSADNIFPIQETAYPEPVKSSPTPAERYLPKTMRKLRAGEQVKILAWGDSVTEASYLPQRETECWQAQFLARLRRLFPTAEIELSRIGMGWAQYRELPQ